MRGSWSDKIQDATGRSPGGSIDDKLHNAYLDNQPPSSVHLGTDASGKIYTAKLEGGTGTSAIYRLSVFDKGLIITMNNGSLSAISSDVERKIRSDTRQINSYRNYELDYGRQRSLPSSKSKSVKFVKFIYWMIILFIVIYFCVA